jgi:hypothetical protein
MTRTRPQILLVMGCCCLGFAVLYFGWLVLCNAGDLLDMLVAALGGEDALESLLQKNLAGGRAILLTSVTVWIETALMGVLAWCGYGLLTVHGAARWSALFFGAVTVPVALLHTILYLAWLTMPQQPVRVVPLMMDAVAIQFAIILSGTMFLPSVTAVYQVPPELPAPVENEPPQPEPGDR